MILSIREGNHSKSVPYAAVYEIIDQAGGNVVGVLELAREIVVSRDAPAGEGKTTKDEKTHDVVVDLQAVLAAIQAKPVS